MDNDRLTAAELHRHFDYLIRQAIESLRAMGYLDVRLSQQPTREQ